MFHLVASIFGFVSFTLIFLFVHSQTNNLAIFPDNKRYFGAALCLIACANGYVLAYNLLKSLIGITGLLSRSDADTLSPLMGTWPDEWYETIEDRPRSHPLDQDA